MEVTWHGHAFFEIVAADGTTVLIDPFLENNPKTTASVADFDPDIVAVTHGDYFDHAGEAHEFGETVLCQSGMARELIQEGYQNVVDLNIGGRFETGGVSFIMTHGFHSLGTAKTGVERSDYGGVAAGYVVDDGDVRSYHSGDTGLFGDMKTVIGDIYDPDVAAVPIGGHHTMEPEHAAIAVDWLGVDAAIPMHYDTFPEIEQDPREFADAIDGADTYVLASGESFEV